ncbi:MAG: hypothetical protein JW867_03360 [Candidatus Omnitrophica bacterium]|nr:hypothetical protein [Candidatus Omnitrophota bacterium]
MKFYKALSLVLLAAVFSACAVKAAKKVEGVERKTIEPTYFERLNGIKEGQVVFLTPYGEIKKGVTMSAVMSVLGFPYDISSIGQDETWYYKLDNGKTISVLFSRNEVVEVKEITSAIAE